VWTELGEKILRSKNAWDVHVSFLLSVGLHFHSQSLAILLHFYAPHRPRFFKGSTIYVDNVPAWVCAKCGEQYFDAPIYKHLEEIARHRNRIMKTVCFPLAEYDMAIS
jgi:hypothetical protein